MAEKEPGKNGSEQSARPLEGLRVLIVENDSDTLEMLKFVLEQNGADVVPTNAVSAALEQFDRQRPDVILADIGMEEMNGYALIAEVRRKDAERASHTKAIAVTAFSTDRDKELAVASGFEGYITKPFDPRELVETLVNLIH
jgi:CheY-like chemotaxis protein